MADTSETESLVAFIKPYRMDYLYRYRSMRSRGLEDVFKKRQIYLPDPTLFNDPFECRPRLTYHKSTLKREKYLKEITKERFPDADKGTIKKLMRKKAKRQLLTDEEHLKRAYEAFVRTIGVLCLSEKNDDILMWSHYSDAHRGICLQFDLSKKGTLFWEALKVIYQEEYPVVNVMDMGNPEEFRKALLTKSNHWQYEQEWRILKTEQEGGSNTYSFSAELLTGVVLGALISDDDRKKVLDWISVYPSKVNLYQARISRMKYELDIEPMRLA
ncbi:MAG: DUF2971 domain-containing protein [Pseudomonadota bacterium]